MTNAVYVLNGPNLNMLGKREPHLYGSVTLPEVEKHCRERGAELGLDIMFEQSNAEYQLIDWLHQAYEEEAAVVINPAGLSFRSIPLLDALKIIQRPIVEIHVTQIHQRGGLYDRSLVSTVADVVICGAGVFGYDLALQAMAARLAELA
ncbi:3-dehydroquinate dehydratase [Arthrobacter sp. Z1-9]